MNRECQIQFPPVDQADSDGLLAISYEINMDYLISAYSNGIFPWPFNDDFIPWFAPSERAVLDFDELHVPRRLKQYLRNSSFKFRVNTDFESVIKACASVKRKRAADSTWITRRMIETYVDFHKAGYAWSFETYSEEDQLIGGLYGVLLKNCFSGESMFHTRDNASKFALLKMIEHLKELGLNWIDVQTMSPHLERFGAKLIPRAEFMRRLKMEQNR